MKKHYRNENDCLNCGAILQGKFCHVCGQENLQIKESIGHVLNHAVSDYFHFDQQFFHTLKPLFFKPGFLTNQYMAGKRVQYLHPVKMYIFISLVYFLLLFSGYTGPTVTKVSDTAAKKGYQRKDIVPGVNITTNGGDTTYAQYLAQQKTLPVDKRDGIVSNFIAKKALEKDDKKLAESIKHNAPKMMFLLLPLFALILKVTFWRSKKFYVEHLIYSFHLHCFLFLFLSIIMLIDMVLPKSWDIWLNIISGLIIIWYIYQSLRTVYNRKPAITILKTISLCFSYLFIFSISMMALLIISALLE